MCAEKTEDSNKNSTNSCCNGMEEMMKNCFSRNREEADCCAQLKDKCGSRAEGHADCMAMFREMQQQNCGQAKDGQSTKKPDCCA